MSWKKTEVVLKKRLNQHGLGKMVEAGILCQKAEQLLPDLFRAVSIRNNILHLELSKANLIAFKMQEGPFLNELNSFAQTRKLPEISKIRLTFI